MRARTHAHTHTHTHTYAHPHTPTQVHKGVLAGEGGIRVAIKVQQPGVRRMMRSDLANMKLGVDLLDL